MAVLYGADAAYLAGKKFGMRAAGQLQRGRNAGGHCLCPQTRCKVYVTVNIFAGNSDLEELPALSTLAGLEVDALIISDPGVGLPGPGNCTRPALPLTPGQYHQLAQRPFLAAGGL